MARRIAKYNNQQINYQNFNLENVNFIVDYVNKYYSATIFKKPNIVFALSLYKHLKDKICYILKYIDFDICFFESNNTGEGLFDSNHAHDIEASFKNYDLKFDRIGETNDRSPRCLWKIVK